MPDVGHRIPPPPQWGDRDLEGIPCLDPNPIGREFPPTHRSGSLIASLGLTLGVVGILGRIHLGRPDALDLPQFPSPPTSLDFVLQEPLPPPPIRPSIPALLPPAHPQGNGARSLDLPPAFQAPPEQLPDTLPVGSAPQDPPFNPYPVDSGLPVSPGGNGYERGTPRPKGSVEASPTRPRLDYQLVPLRKENLRITASFQDLNLHGTQVHVRIQINDAGIPIHAEAIAGPPSLRKRCVEAALKWRFEPLSRHGLSAPQSLTIHFSVIAMQ